MGERYWEVDAVRGISLIGMILFHITSLMVIFHMAFTLDWYYEICRYIHLGTSVFVIISGVALVLRYGRMTGHSKREYHTAIFRRGIQIFLIGIAIAVIASLAIHFIIGDGNYMLFNFLQMMGLSMILCIPFLRLGKWNIIPAAILIGAGFLVKSIHTGPIWLLPFGFSRTACSIRVTTSRSFPGSASCFLASPSVPSSIPRVSADFASRTQGLSAEHLP